MLLVQLRPIPHFNLLCQTRKTGYIYHLNLESSCKACGEGMQDNKGSSRSHSSYPNLKLASEAEAGMKFIVNIGILFASEKNICRAVSFANH